MTKHYTTTFNYLGRKITISASVSDKYEDRDRFKPTVAADWMTQWLREYGIMNIRCIHAKNLQEVKRKEVVRWADTVKQMKEAEEAFQNGETEMNATDKLVITLYANRDARR